MKGKKSGAEEEEKEELRFSPRPNRAGEISWRPWGDGAFTEAREQGRLVLLSISAVWCHWCHVMDETTSVSYTHLRAHETRHDLVCRLLLEKKKKKKNKKK